MMDWLLHNTLRVLVVLAALWTIGIVGLGVMAVGAVVYHVFDPDCPTVFCVPGGE